MFHRFLGLESLKKIYASVGGIEDIFSQGFLPIIDDNSGNFYCIKGHEDLIYFIDHEDGYTINAAGTLTKFLTSLVKEKVNS